MSQMYDNQIVTDMTAKTGHSYHVVIMEQGGRLVQMRLPQTVEGRYRFGQDGTNSDFPLSVKAEDGKWIAVCESSAYFIVHRTAVRKAEIRDNLLLEMVYQDKCHLFFAEAEKEGDRVFYPYHIRCYNRITIGRSTENDICYDNPLVSRQHCSLEWENGEWNIVDQNSTNGVYLNERAVQSSPVHVGDRIYLIGLRILIGAGYIAINNGNQRATVSAKLLSLMENCDSDWFSDCPIPEDSPYINRMPRRRELLAPAPIELEAPPSSIVNKMPLLLKMGNPLLMGGRAIFTGNIFSAVTSMMLPLLTQGFTEKDRKDYEQKRLVKYREYLEQKKQDIQTERKHEEDVLASMYPDVNTVLNFASHKERLWERQRRDADFLSVRVGSGEVPLYASIECPRRRFDLENDELEEEMYAIGESKVRLESAPVMLSLRESYVCGITGTTEEAAELMRNLIIQIAMTHSYDEVKMVLLTDEAGMDVYRFALYIPHFWDNRRSVRYIAKSKSDAQQLSKELKKLYEEYTDSKVNTKKLLKTKPAYVILVQTKEMFDAVEVLREMTEQEEYSGFSVITAFENPPKDTMVLMTMGRPNTLSDLRNPEKEIILFKQDYYPPELGDYQLHKLMNAKLHLDEQQSGLPNTVTFLDMYGVGKVEYLNPMKRWEENNPIKSLAAPIGIGTDGKLFQLDLHEKKQGPHGLVAGSTGSGKSEFIITYVLSMAVNYSPDEVAFVLIDYKGGGLADAFVDKKRGIHLPHVVGTITNLDGAGIQRSLLSIKSELNRRQKVFSDAKSETGEGTMDIYDYQRLYRQRRVREPLPHLFIISDEFAELKKQQPEFMEELISIARIGRSLGVHLILATQKPSGVVNDQIWSNTKFRVCLKVAEKSDSMEMLKRPEAAELKNTGRFYLQVGYNELFALGQSAWCGASYEEEEEHSVEKEAVVQFLDTTGQVILTKKPEKRRIGTGKKQIVAIVEYLSDLAKRAGMVPRLLMKECLPAKLDYQTLLHNAENNQREDCRVLLGMADDPERQEQFPLLFDLNSFHHMLLVGPSGSGKSNFLRTLLWSAVTRYEADKINYYIVDLSGGALSVFRNMPHCGAYLTQDKEKEFDRLLSMLREIIAERKKLFSDADVTSFESYLQSAELPLILVVIDSYQNIATGFTKGSEIAAYIHTILAEAANCGIRFLFTVNHSNECSTRAKQEIDCAFALSPKDRYEAGEILSSKVNAIPPVLPGRGICLVKGRPLEFHTAKFRVEDTEQNALQMMKDELSHLAEHTECRVKAKILPVITAEQTYEDFSLGFENGRIPLGYSVYNRKPVALPLQQMTSIPIYFGNPNGVRPVLHNLLYTAAQNGMDVRIVKRFEDSVFTSTDNLLNGYSGHAEVMYCQENEIHALAEELNRIVMERNELVNEYSDKMGIPREERGRAKKAAAFIRERTTPIMVLFESFADFAGLKKTEFADKVFRAFLGSLKGYNIYFIGCVYPENNSSLRADPLLGRMTQTDVQLMFGGRYDMQCLSSAMPSEYRRIQKVSPQYDRGLMLYREEWYEIQMPCGAMTVPVLDPEDAPIV